MPAKLKGQHQKKRKKTREEFRLLIPKYLKDSETANSISNRDLKLLEKMLNRNDGGIAKKTRTF